MSGLSGKRLGAYELLERLGEGGMAEVYRARQTTAFGREVAIKVIRAELGRESDYRTRFLREAQAIAKLAHPHILPLIEVGEEADTLYLVMPLIREGTLFDALERRQGPLPLEEALPLFIQLCAAVHYAHSQGIIHRDIKPENVLLQHGTHVLLSDFGIARDRAQSQITSVGLVMGSAAYMAPEQVLGQTDARSDIYSLGVVLYTIVTGTLPYTGASMLEMIARHSNAPIPDPRAINPLVTPALSAIIQKAMAKNPQERFPSANAFGQAVQQIAAGFPAASPASPAQGFPGSSALQQPSATTQAPAPGAPSAPLNTSARASEGDAYMTRPASGSPAPGQENSTTRQADLLATRVGTPDALTGTGAQAASLPVSLPPVSGSVAPAPEIAAPRRRKQFRLVLFASLAAVLVLVGLGAGLVYWTSSGSKANASATPTAGAVDFLTYRNTDGTFRIHYPSGWQESKSATGTGADFHGLVSASFDVANDGTSLSNAGNAVDQLCESASGAAAERTLITLGGQEWVQEKCGKSLDGNLITIAEAVVYKGDLFMIEYSALSAGFDRDQARYFVPMEHSFTFLK
jgi:serine/threonine protein kinase